MNRIIGFLLEQQQLLTFVFREALFDIFDPIFREVNRLVKEQVDSARIKRFEKGRQDGLAIKVRSML